MSSNKHLALLVDLILTLVWDPLNESIFLHTLKLGLVTWITGLNLKYHVSPSQKYIACLGTIYPPCKHCPPMPSNSSLPSSKLTNPVDRWLPPNVSYSTLQRLYSSISFSLPRHLGGCPTTLTTHDQQPLAQKVTSKAVRNRLRKAGLKLLGSQKSPFSQGLIGKEAGVCPRAPALDSGWLYQGGLVRWDQDS